jgi:glycosyltransferase involved in cell wall biosynthesis
MKVLFLASGNWKILSPFVEEQAESLKKKNVHIEYFLIQGKGYSGYLKNYPSLIKAIHNFKPDLIHAHYGLSGLLGVIQRKVPVVVTYHGSDINDKSILKYSRFAIRLSSYNIFVSQELKTKANAGSTSSAVIPCGVDLKVFKNTEIIKPLLEKITTKDKKIILFSSSFDNPDKNYALAKKAIELIGDQVKLIELKGYKRHQVNEIINQSDVALMTSLNEGSPQFIKEAMACNCPIVSTDVGDVKRVIGETKGCYITTFDPLNVAEKIKLAIEFGKKTDGRERIIELGLDTETIADKIYTVYNNVLNKGK